VATPTPDLNADLPQWGIFTGPVPDIIQQVTGQMTWPAVIAWMEDQMSSAGVNPDTFAGSFGISVDPETGEVQGVEIVARERPDDPPAVPGEEPPSTPTEEGGAP